MSTFKHTPEEARHMWVEALRSGEFRQCQHYLSILGKGDCCLGVACKLFIREEHPIQTTTGARDVRDGRGDIVDVEIVRYEGCSTDLPPRVQRWLGLDGPSGRYGNGHHLANDNDEGKSFSDIAAIIGSTPEGLLASR